MYDAVTAANIPGDARMVAGYIDRIKLAPWSAADWARFPNAVKVTIVKKAATNDGDVLDVEPGDASPGEAPGWVQMRRAAGADPTIYCSLALWPSVRNAFSAAGVAEPHYWIAHYDGDPAIPAGAIAKQYLGNVAPGYDVSSVADYWPAVDGAGPASTGVEIMERITVTPPNAEENTLRVFLSGSPGAAVVIRPRLGGDGFSKPMWVGNIYAWGNDHQGVGHNPAQSGGYNARLTSHRRYDLPGAIWADINYSAADPFEVDIVG
nr:glycoside hydrolase family 25 protein [Amycolatopsis vancoresmycina]